jgi:hypothetical protein
MNKIKLMFGSALICCGISVAAVAGDEDGFVAGAKPHERPADAPVLVDTGEKKPKEWYDNAVTGVEPPFPYSFKFLDDQGNWYTPFNRPGMTGPYDIRNWHK